MASRQENLETAALRNRLSSATHFLLECFGSMHYLKMAKCICFVLKDVGTYLHQMDLTSLEEAFHEIPFTTLDELGFLKKITDRMNNELQSTKVLGLVKDKASSERQSGVTKGELLLLFFVCYLSVNGKTHYKKICKNLCDWAPSGVSLDMLSTSVQSKLEYFKKYKEHFRMDRSGSLELHNSFHSLFEVIPFDSGSSQKKNHDDSNINEHFSFESFEEKASMCINNSSQNSQEKPCGNTPSVWDFDVSEELFKSLNLPINSLDILTERIIDGIAYLCNFFKLNVHSSFLQVVIHVIKRGWVFFKLPQSYQKAVIKKCFESFCVDEKGNVTYLHVLEKHKYILSDKRQCLICFTYIISEERSMHYQEAWKQYRKHSGWNDYLEDSKQLSYFTKRPLFFLVDDSGFVSIQNMKTIDFDYVPIIMPESSSKISCRHFSISVESSEMSASKNILGVMNENLHHDEMTSPKDSRCFDDSTYTKFGESTYFVLSVFGPLSCTHITECISYVFPSNAASLTALTREERQNMFLSLPSVILKDGNLQLLEPFPFIKRHVSLTKLLSLFTTSYLAVNGKTHYTILVQKLYQLAPEIAFSDFQNSSNPKWYSYFSKSKLFAMTSKGYLTLPFSFFKIAIVIDAASPQEQFGADNSVDVPVKTPNTDGGMKTLPTDDETSCDPPKEYNNLQFPVVSKKCFISASVSNLSSNDTWNNKSSHTTPDPSNYGENESFDSSTTFNVPKITNSKVTVPELDVKGILNDLENGMGIDDSTYKDMGAAVSFLLSVFGPLSCKHVSECISHCFKQIAKLLTEITQEKRKEILSSFPGIELKGSYLKLIKQHEFFIQYLSYEDYLYLFTTSFLALNGKTHYKVLLDKLSLMAPDVADYFVEYFGDTWYDHFLRKPKCFVRMPSDHLKLPSSFYQYAKAFRFSPALSQVGSCNNEFLNGEDSNNKILNSGSKNMSDQNSVSKVENSEDLNIVPTLNANGICKLARKGAVFLLKYFKCSFDFNLVCIILHALDIARRHFLLLPESDQIDLVKRILALFKTVTSQCTSREKIPFTMDQRDALFISYAVGQRGKLHFKSLIELFEKHNMGTYALLKKDGYFHGDNPLFSLDMDLRIGLKNFPTAKWMYERLSLPSTGVPDLMVICRTEAACSDAESTEVTNKGTESAEVDDNRTESSDAELIALESFSECPAGTSIDLVDNISNGIDHLLKYFEVNIHSSVLEIILHVTGDQCLNSFLKLTPRQTMSVLLLSYSSIYVDAQGMMVPIFTRKSGKTSSKRDMALCMAYIVSQKGPILFHKIFKEYHERTGITQQWKYTEQMKYFKNRGSIFSVGPSGLVRLTKLPQISLDYASIILQRRLSNSIFEDVPNTKLPGINNKQSEKNIQPVLDVTFSDYIEYKCSVQDLKDDATVVVKPPLNKKMINRVIGSILYLCNCFYLVEKKVLVYMILGILIDVEAYFLELPVEDKDDFIEKCFFNEYVQHSKDIRHVCSEVVSSPFETLISDDEKVVLFSTYLLIREKEVHFTHIFNRLQECNDFVKKSFLNVSNLYNFFSKRKDMFSMNSDGFVKLLLSLKKSNTTFDLNKQTFKDNLTSSFKDFPFSHEKDSDQSGIPGCTEVDQSNLHLNSVNLTSCDIKDYDGEPSISKDEVPSLSAKLVHETEKEEPFSLVEHDPTITASICSKQVEYSLKQGSEISSNLNSNEVEFSAVSKLPSISNVSTKDDIGFTQIPTSISNDVPLLKNQNIPDCVKMQKSNCEAHQPKIGHIPVKSRSLIISRILDKTDGVDQIYTNAATVNRDPTTTQDKFSLLELENSDQVLSVSSGNSPEKYSHCCCATSITKELRTKNFFIVILSQSKDGFPVFDLLEKLLFASEEVQHYMSCVYKKDILHFIHNHDEFYVSPTSGNICLKT